MGLGVLCRIVEKIGESLGGGVFGWGYFEREKMVGSNYFLPGPTTF